MKLFIRRLQSVGRIGGAVALTQAGTIIQASFLASFLALSFTACSDAPVGSKNRPFTMYFVPSVDAETVTTSADAITKHVSKYLTDKINGGKETFHIKAAIPTSYIAVVEAFGTKKADFAAFNTFSYILAKDIKKYDVEAFINVVRGEGETHYKGQIVARRDSGIKTIQDLNGKKFAFTDPASTSGYILPQKLFNDAGITLGGTVFAQKHDNVITMVYQKQVDAGATYYSEPHGGQIRDARARVKTQFPDVESKVEIIAFTQTIPNEPWVVRGDLTGDPQKNAEIKKHLTDALIAFAEDEKGKKVLTDVYSLTGLSRATDDTFKEIREIVLNSNLDLHDLLSDKKDAAKKPAPAAQKSGQNSSQHSKQEAGEQEKA